MAKKSNDGWDTTPGRTGKRTIDQIMDKNNKKSSDDGSGSGDGSGSSSSANAKSSKKKKKQKADTSKTYTTAKLVAPSTRHIAPEQYSVSRAGVDLYRTDENNYVPYVPTGSVSGVGTTTVEDDTIDSSDEQDVKGYSLHLGAIQDTYHRGDVKSFNFESSYADMEDSATVDAPIGRDKSNRKKMCVTGDNSKDAITHIRVLERYKSSTLIECKLETGRTHQIRVHMDYIKHPVVNDPVYGYNKMDDKEFGQMLHAKEIGFVHPITGEFLHFEAPVPKRFNEILEVYRNM